MSTQSYAPTQGITYSGELRSSMAAVPSAMGAHADGKTPLPFFGTQPQHTPHDQHHGGYASHGQAPQRQHHQSRSQQPLQVPHCLRAAMSANQSLRAAVDANQSLFPAIAGVASGGLRQDSDEASQQRQDEASMLILNHAIHLTTQLVSGRPVRHDAAVQSLVLLQRVTSELKADPVTGTIQLPAPADPHGGSLLERTASQGLDFERMPSWAPSLSAHGPFGSEVSSSLVQHFGRTLSAESMQDPLGNGHGFQQLCHLPASSDAQLQNAIEMLPADASLWNLSMAASGGGAGAAASASVGVRSNASARASAASLQTSSAAAAAESQSNAGSEASSGAAFTATSPAFEGTARTAARGRNQTRVVCPVCGGQGRDGPSRACCSCYSGWFHDAEKLIRNGLVVLSNNQAETLKAAEQGMRGLRRPCSAGYRCPPAAYSHATPAKQRCCRCRSLAFLRVLPDVAYSMLLRRAHTMTEGAKRTLEQVAAGAAGGEHGNDRDRDDRRGA